MIALLCAHIAFGADVASDEPCGNEVAEPVKVAIHYVLGMPNHLLKPQHQDRDETQVLVVVPTLECVLDDRNIQSPSSTALRFRSPDYLNDDALKNGRSDLFIVVSRLELSGDYEAEVNIGVFHLRKEGDRVIGYGCDAPAQLNKTDDGWQFNNWGRTMCS